MLAFVSLSSHATSPSVSDASTDISGHVLLSAGPGQTIAANDIANTLVYFVPARNHVHVKPGHFTIYTVNHDFRPAAMAVPLGSTVTFTNLDELLHNLYSTTPNSTFDFQFQASGQSISHSFTHAGPVLIGCSVHRSMELDLLVVPTPYISSVSQDGHFELHGLPKGPGQLYFWNPRVGLVQSTMKVPASNVTQPLLAIKPAVATELNLGQIR
jgi:plastocyanin